MQSPQGRFGPNGLSAGLAAVLLGVLVAAVVAVTADWLELTTAVQIFFIALAAGLVMWGLFATRLLAVAWAWTTARIREIVDRGGGSHDIELLWFLPFSLVFALLAAGLGVLAVIDGWDLSLADVTPWVLGGLSLVAAIIALMFFSYAPPGPNWVQRLAGIDGRGLLIMVGVAIVALGTLEFFDYRDGQEPGLGWLAIVGVGLLIGLIGIGRQPRSRRDHTATLWEAARHARRSAIDAERFRARAESDAPSPQDARYLRAKEAADEAARRADEADKAVHNASDKEVQVLRLTDVANRKAAEAAQQARVARDMARQLSKRKP